MSEKRSYQILLVDDEPGDIALTRLALAEAPYVCEISVARNGREALARLRREAPYGGAPFPDLMLLDLNMPLMNGREVLAAMKADPRLARLPVVVLSTSDMEGDVAASYGLGAHGYIVKPFDLETLSQALQAVQSYWFGTVRRPGHAAL